ncbi:M23 family peptidase [Streptomyces alfalfae]|uniref:Peptidase n=1 Tax=Streptomyces alfalfae TaxID=1642299 RepID=A0A1P8TEB2_9ACTN|nr:MULTISPECIES: M23 family metallopeptidase [Streptomyces]AYA16332.1 M23 family metallopeptidase [Streptomyces fradiae]APY85966.1 peptidase [Streptomyces alfalfae]QQC91795.1 M23 family metallopeptidase [Streptomyces alfalfae]QUI34311.1 M23 family metallopeptidase [Streptomyces alfalfae]RXX38319.1 M23 family peptidase [Streptomyces alfalfae]
MAFTRATGKHRRPSRLTRTTANAAGVAALTTTGVIGGLAAPALAAADDAPIEHTGLTQAISVGDSLAASVDAQAAAQQQAADAAAAAKKAEEAAKKRAAEEKRKAEAEAKAKAKKEREQKERAAREAERKRLNTYVSPISGSYVSTGYQTGGAMWSSGSHTGVDFHAASGTPVHAVGSGTVVEAGWGGAYGNNVVIKMNDGTYTQYGHLSSLGVTVGQTVTPGQQIGLAGSTGNSSGPHLHFEARTGAEYGSDIDPVAYLRAHGVNV